MTPDAFTENSYYSGLNRYLDQYWENRIQPEYQPKNEFTLQWESSNKWVLFLPEPAPLSESEIEIFLRKEHEVYATLLD